MPFDRGWRTRTVLRWNKYRLKIRNSNHLAVMFSLPSVKMPILRMTCYPMVLLSANRLILRTIIMKANAPSVKLTFSRTGHVILYVRSGRLRPPAICRPCRCGAGVSLRWRGRLSRCSRLRRGSWPPRVLPERPCSSRQGSSSILPCPLPGPA